MKTNRWEDLKAADPDVKTPEYRVAYTQARRDLMLGLRVGAARSSGPHPVGTCPPDRHPPAEHRPPRGRRRDPKLDTLARIAGALGMELEVSFRPAKRTTAKATPKKRISAATDSKATSTAAITGPRRNVATTGESTRTPSAVSSRGPARTLTAPGGVKGPMPLRRGRAARPRAGPDRLAHALPSSGRRGPQTPPTQASRDGGQRRRRIGLHEDPVRPPVETGGGPLHHRRRARRGPVDDVVVGGQQLAEDRRHAGLGHCGSRGVGRASRG